MSQVDLQRWLILPDIHIPYHNRSALELIEKHVIPAFSWFGLILLGDVFDFYSVSSFPKNPQRLKGLQHETKAGFDFLTRIGTVTPWQRKVFIEGNHEKRLTRFLSEHAPEIYEIVLGWWETGFKEWEYVPYQEDIHIGKVFFTHDVGRSGARSTELSLNDYQDNVVVGHNHIMDYLVKGNAKGEAHVGASFGWLGDVGQIDYRHRMKCRRDWVAGFGTALIYPQKGYVYLTPHPIVNNTCVVEGQLFELNGGNHDKKKRR